MRRLLHLFALLAMMLAPMAMHGAPAAAASAPSPGHHSAGEAAHCGGSGQREEQKEKGRSADCAIACSAMPCASHLSEPLSLPRAGFAATLSPFFAGTAPGSDPPPPRLS